MAGTAVIAALMQALMKALFAPLWRWSKLVFSVKTS
jgi:hypothetical protein